MFNRRQNKKKIYIRIFISLALCIVVTMMFLSTILYMNFEKVASGQIYTANMKSLDLVSRQVSNMAKTAMTVSSQIYRDVSISSLLYYSHPDVFDQGPAYWQLTNYRLSIPFIDSIYTYNSMIGQFYVESGDNKPLPGEEFADKQAISIIDNYINYKPYMPIPRRYINEKGVEKFYYTFIMYDLMAGKKLNSAVIINISEDWINNLTNYEPDSKGSYTFIIDKKGVVISNTAKFSMMSDYSGEGFIKTILSDIDASGYFVDNVNGVKSLIVYTRPDYYGWRYIRILPWNEIFSKIENIRTITISISFAILLLGIIIAFILSKRIYIPIGKMYLNIETLEIEKRKNAREEFLKDIALGKGINYRDNMYEMYNKMGIGIGIEEEICALLFKIDQYNDFIRKCSLDEINTCKRTIVNMSDEILSKEFKVEAVNLGKDAILFIIEVPEAAAEFGDILHKKIKDIQTNVKNNLNISISVTVSEQGQSVENIHQLYNQVMEASLHRLFYGYGCVISAEVVMDLKVKEFTYPVQKEKILVDAIMSNKMDEAKQIYNEIINFTKQYSIMAYNLTVSHLVFAINNVINTIKSNNTSLDTMDFSISSLLLNETETIDEVNEKFYDLFDKIENGFAEKKSSRYGNIVNKITEIILSEYSKPNFCIDSIAGAMGMSVPYICRIYKQYTMGTILDRIVEIRMQKARELLQETNLAVVDVAEKVGFNNISNFYRAFKKENGVTPNEFRNNQRQS